MLSDEVIDKVVERLVRRIEEGNTYVLKQIGESIKKIGTLSPSKARQLSQIMKYGGDYDKITNKLAKITEQNVKDIQKIFDEVAKNDLEFAKQFYDYRGAKYIPYEENTALQNHVRALANTTADEYRNFARTTAFGQEVNGTMQYTNVGLAYQDIIDEATLSISEGKTTFDSEMSSVIQSLGEQGLQTVDYQSGRHMRLDSAIRMHLRGALKDLHNQTQLIFGEEFGADGVEVSVHSFPAPDHEEVQGKQFTFEEYEKLQSTGKAKTYKGETIDIHSVSKKGKISFRPISEYNCYHYIFSVVLGASEQEYSDEELKAIAEENEQGFDYGDNHYTMYEGTQVQRQLETEIRKQKDIMTIAKASGQTDVFNKSQLTINLLTDKYKDFSRISGLPTYMDRMKVSGYRKYKANFITEDSPLYDRIINTKQIYHSTDKLKLLFEKNNITGNLQVQEKGATTANYGKEGVFLKPQSLNYSVKLYNGDRGNENTKTRAEKLRTTSINKFINEAGVKHMYSTAVVKDLPLIENATLIRTYKGSDNYNYLKKISEKYNIPIEEYEPIKRKAKK